jgi:hypothetical protein
MKKLYFWFWNLASLGIVTISLLDKNDDNTLFWIILWGICVIMGGLTRIEELLESKK